MVDREPESTASTGSAMRRRSAFVAEVADTIASWHCKEQESFVLGLSGRWGEGKSFFLDELGTELKTRGFKVIDLNPWKYAADRVAFLRAFLVQLLETQSRWSRLCAAGRLAQQGQMSDAWTMLGPRRRLLDRLKTDVTRQRISVFRLFLLLVPVVAVYWMYTNGLDAQTKSTIDQLKLPITLFLVPVSVWLIQGLVNSQASSKAATAVDEFDSLVSLALGAPRLKDGKPVRAWGVRNVVVFVDDLDRVTADVARGVLDNLRTFFDKPLLSFVVTGDHSVLEASLGRELAPNREADQPEEGRRFMKKVFNLYWRLPQPVRSDFESFVDRQLALRHVEVETCVPVAEDQALLRQWLLDFCDGNLRLVIRTLDTLLFSLRLVRAQAALARNEERAGLNQVLDKPMLLGRVLLIQDRCAPLFEAIVETPSLLIELDRGVALAKLAAQDGPEQDPVGEFLNRLEARLERRTLNPDQVAFLKRFAYQPPFFYVSDGRGQVVFHPGPWLHLAGDLSFKDASGPTPDDFVRDTANMNSEALSVAIARCSEAKAGQAAGAVILALATTSVTVDDRVQKVLLLLRLSQEAEPDAPLASALTDDSLDALEQLLEGASEDQRVDVLIALLTCIDRHHHKIPEEKAPLFAFHERANLARLPRQPYTQLGADLVLDWLITYYTQDAPDCVLQMDELLPFVTGHGSLDLLRQISDQLVSDLMSDADTDRRNRRARILQGYVPEGSELLRSAVIGALWKEDVWSWADTTATDDADAVPWNKADLRAALCVWVVAAPDAPTLLDRLRYASGKLSDVADALWRRLYDERDGDLLGLLGALVSDQAIAALSMPTDVATGLYRDRAALVVGTEDEQQAIGLAGPLAPQGWPWRLADRKVARASLTPIARSRARRQTLQALVRPFWEAWGA